MTESELIAEACKITLTLTVTKDSDLAMLKMLCAQNGAKLETRELVSIN